MGLSGIEVKRPPAASVGLLTNMPVVSKRGSTGLGSIHDNTHVGVGSDCLSVRGRAFESFQLPWSELAYKSRINGSVYE